MQVFSYLISSSLKRYSLLFLVFAIFIFFISHYVASSYGLPQWITIQIKAEKRILLNVYYDIGRGYGEQYSVARWVTGRDDFQTVRLKLPSRLLRAFRIGPLSEPGIVHIKSIKLESLFGKDHVWPAERILKEFQPLHDIGRFDLVNDSLLVESTGNDPYFFINASVPFINKISFGGLTLVVIFVFFGLFLICKLLLMPTRINITFLPNFDIKERYLVGLIIGFVFILNYPKLHLYFLSDDFVFMRYLTEIFGARGSYHMNPIPRFFFFYIGYHFVGLNPLYYHLITLLLHTANVLLVFKLAQKLLNNKWISTVASLLFATYFMNYEVVYWITGIFYILLTLFFISTLIFFMRYLRKKNKIYYALFVTTFALAVFTMEQGITLLIACFLCEILIAGDSKGIQSSNWKQERLFIIRSTKKYIPPIISIILLFILKRLMDQRFVIGNTTFESFVGTTFAIIWYLFIPYSKSIIYNPLEWNYRIYLTLLVAGIIGYFLVKSRQQHNLRTEGSAIYKSDLRIYLFLLGCILGYVIPQSIAVGIQARYFYLPSVFSSIILGNLLIKNLSFIRRSKNHIRLLFHSVIIIFIVITFPVNIRFLNNQYTHWETASRITKNVISDTKLYLSDKIKGQYLYYVNLPDGIYSHNNFGWPDAYVFRNGISDAINLYYAKKNIGIVNAYRTENPDVVPSHGHELVSIDQLHLLAADEKNLVLIYDAKMQTLRRLMPGNAI
jgi:hypothetical protein